ncbi:unnamed protein product [Linum trigynum]|uniref:Uncharacterized protein n=1 Tax=Linum trigynum TaxID=586398 RepID=A0AAV2GBC1_9ROSI
MDMNEVEKKEQEDGNGKVVVEAKDEDEKEVGLSTTMNLLTSQLEQTFKEEVAELEEVLDEKEEVLVEGLTIVTCEEDAQALILSQEEPELEVEDEEKVLPITNMIMDFDHDEINLKEGPKQSLIEEATDHVELTIEDGILPKDVYDNEDMSSLLEMKCHTMKFILERDEDCNSLLMSLAFKEHTLARG